jgi:AmpD protein
VNPGVSNGWLNGIRQIPSPNFSQRPPDAVIDLLVIHNISLPPGQFDTGCVEAFFCNQLDVSQDSYFEAIATLKVSAHFFIARSGEITQFVSIHDRAWHAGASSFAGVADCNDYSIGIELEGCDDIPYTVPQYSALVDLTRQIQNIFPPITSSRIVGHAHIAPGRKTDPGAAFEWDQYFSALNQVAGSL